MITRMLCVAALVAASHFAAPAIAQGSAHANRAGSSWVYGVGSTQSAVETISQYFGWLTASEQYDVKGTYENTTISIYEQGYGATAYGERWISCAVNRSAVNVSRQQASVAATLDGTSPSCSQYGFVLDWLNGTWQPWPFPSPVAVSGEWHDARYQQQGTSTGMWTDNQTGTSSRSTCIYSYQNDAQGGFAVGVNAYTFAAPGAGSFNFSNCSSSSR